MTQFQALLFPSNIFHLIKEIEINLGVFEIIITVRKEVSKVMFLQACVCPHGGCLPQCVLGYHPRSRHPPAKETPCQGDPLCQGDFPTKETPLPRRPPAKETPHQGDPPAKGTPTPERRPLLRTVRILLECILV